MTLLWIILAFLAGSIPFSVWIGRLALGTDIRRFGDANPGATNVVRAGGRTAALIVLLLDGLKGALPVALALQVPPSSTPAAVGLALAPIAGHAFSPFLRGRGGKAVAVSAGVWAALLGWPILFILGVALLFFYLLIDNDGWSVIFTLLVLAFYLYIGRENSPLFEIWLGNLLIVSWKHRSDLTRRPHLRLAAGRSRGL